MIIKELLKGDSVRLATFSDDNVKTLNNWYCDSEFLRYYDYLPAFPKSEFQLIEMIKDVRKSNDMYIFAIREKLNDKLIGVCGFENIIWNNGTSNIYIGLGDKEYRGKGMAKEALSLAIDFGFMELNFHRIQLSVISYNNAAISLYEKLGFIREGVMREFVCRDNKRFDLYTYGLLRRELVK